MRDVQDIKEIIVFAKDDVITTEIHLTQCSGSVIMGRDHSFQRTTGWER
jgi:hypothetical protein